MRQLESKTGTTGSILWARYSFSPNRFKYCGPDKNLELFEYTSRKKTDGGLTQILSNFEAAFPYIDFIAHENQIKDSFDFRAVEAYWLGNDLLYNIDLNRFYRHLQGRYLERSKGRTAFESSINNLAKGAKPHHSFHVLEIFQKIGSMRGIDHGPVLDTINNCLIGWGKVIQIGNDFLEVEHQPLKVSDDKLLFDVIHKKKLEYKFKNKSFFENPQVGDWVSIHWNWACDILTSRQLNNLQKWTIWHLNLVNSLSVPNR